MAILVQYRCRSCGRDADHWASSPAPDQTECRSCFGTARRMFGGALLRGKSSATAAPSGHAGAHQRTGPGCAPGLPASCTLTPSAARMLDAHLHGDNRAIDRESERQTKAISEGTLDPRGPVQTLFSGGPVSG